MEFLGRLFINARIKVITGLHIGTGGTGGIGLVDNPVLRDPLTRRPIIPGSTLKGRLRHALEIICSDDKPAVYRLFGSSVDAASQRVCGRLLLRDAHLSEESAAMLEAMDSDLLYVELKAENRIDRARGVAEHPRQNERLPAGAQLNWQMVYNCWSKEEASDDLQNLDAAFRFVEDEYIGGSGSRGYGQVEFSIHELSWLTLANYRESSEAKLLITERKKWLADAAGLIGLIASQGA